MWLVFLAQVDVPDKDTFFSSSAGQVIWYLFIAMFVFAGIAGGVTGIRSLIRSYSDGKAWTRSKWKERKRRDELLDQILSPQGWANGSKNIVEAHKEIYQKVAEVGDKVEAVQRSLDDLVGRPQLPG